MHAENPTGSAAWAELRLGPVFEADLHMCSVGLKCPKTGLPVLKPTRILSTDRELVGELRSCRCPGHQSHAHLEGTWKGKNLTHYAESYPAAFCSKIAKTMAKRDSQVCADNDVFLNTDAETDAEADSERSEPEAGSAGREASLPGLIPVFMPQWSRSSM